MGLHFLLASSLTYDLNLQGKTLTMLSLIIATKFDVPVDHHKSTLIGMLVLALFEIFYSSGT